MAFESQTGLGVMAQYGPRETGVSIGVEHSKDSKHQLSIELTSEGLKDEFLPPVVLPKTAVIEAAYLTVDVAIPGVTGISIGEGNAEATNGITLGTADVTTLGTADVAAKLTGTWAVGTSQTKAARIGIAVTGAPTTNDGRASLVIDYRYKRRKDDEFEADPGTEPAGYRPQFVG